MICFSSVFDFNSLNFLQGLKCPAYKIASFENNHLPLIEKVAATRKPTIISTGMANKQEISEAIDVIQNKGNHDIIIIC